VARKFGVSRDLIWRHMRHVPQTTIANYLAGPKTIEELRERALAENGSVLDYLGSLRSLLFGAIVTSAKAQSASSLMMLSGRMIQCLEAIGKLTGEITRDDRSINVTTNVAVMSDSRFLELQSGLLRIAREFPAARGSIVSLLRDLDAKGAPGLQGSLPRSSAMDVAPMSSEAPHGLTCPAAGPPTIEHEASPDAA
jgi:hypothetical protein